MRAPLTWLSELCDPGLDVRALASRLALTGTEVDRIDHHGVSALEHFVVGRTLTCVQHPNADRLRVLTVDVGDTEPAHIVCGAPNVAAGMTVAVARPGSVMPDGLKLKKAKLRGEISEGMICSADELGINSDHDGIIVLGEALAGGDALAAGTPLADVLPISTDVLELEITPNRPDCLSMYGVAREVHAATGAPLAAAPWADDPGTAGPVPGFSVDVQAPDLCPRFTARLFEDVTVGPSPLWLQARLMAAGMRPIDLVVDVTNYAMLLTGQPLHAFDADRVAGGTLTVRRAADGERMTTLDDVERTLDPDVLVICDADGPTSIAGLMGGARSEILPSTTRVLLEAATWDGPNLQRTSARLALRTEASGRFEKGLPGEATAEGLALASRLLVELGGARLVDGTIDEQAPDAMPAPQVIRLRDARVEGLLGVPVERSASARVLTALGFTVADATDGLDVTVPAFRRADVTREADLIEEIARLEVLDRLPATLPARGSIGRLTPAQRLRRRAEDALVGVGLLEAVGWSFADPRLPDRLRLGADDPRRSALRLRNPMSEDASTMRTTLVGSLLDNVGRNRARGQESIALFEVGAVYLPASGSAHAPEATTGRAGDPDPRHADRTPLPDERRHIGALMTGALHPATWGDPAPGHADVFSARSAVEALAGALRSPVTVRALDDGSTEPFLHPGRAGHVLVDGDVVGWFGELHPRVAAGWDLERVAGFELDLDALIAAADVLPAFAEVTAFPAVRQDLAVVVAADVTAGSVIDVVRASGGPLLQHAEVFDVFRGEQVGEGRVSLAVRLDFRAADRTLTEDEVSARRKRIVSALTAELGGELRG